MPKLTIKDKDYYTDDFNEQQMSAYNEIRYAKEQVERMEYTISVMNARCNMLADFIVQVAEAPKEESDGNETQAPE